MNGKEHLPDTSNGQDGPENEWVIFTIGEAAWSTCGVSGKDEEEGGREGGTFQETSFTKISVQKKNETVVVVVG